MKADQDNRIRQEAELKRRLRNTSASFRTKADRHDLNTKNIIYCSFSTPHFSVCREEAQRDARRRLERFGVELESVRGKRVLDLGCNNGAMLFEVSNFFPQYGLGIEFDKDKVEIAEDIAKLSNLDQLQFRVGDLDEIDASLLKGPYDIVFCLAVEAHVRFPDRLYRLLSSVTKGLLYFEANGATKRDDVESKLLSVGFSSVEYLGKCDDDMVERNNRRPLFVAIKA